MFGVILWSDPLSGEAVIWCEDRAGLAYYDEPTCREQSACGAMCRAARFDAGDLVEFELGAAQGQRLTATNLTAVGDRGQSMPATRRAAATTSAPTGAATPSDTGERAEVINLRRRRRVSPGFFALSRRG